MLSVGQNIGALGARRGNNNSDQGIGRPRRRYVTHCRHSALASVKYSENAHFPNS